MTDAMRTLWDTIASNDALPYRLAVGLSIFAVLAIVDYRRNGPNATRWREYAFLAVCVLFAVAYGIANDLITSRISVEYFLYFKGVADRVSGEVAAHPELHRGELDLQAMRIGTLATWSVGLIVGAAMLITNTVGQRPRLRMRRMLPLISIVFVCAIAFAVAFGVLGWTDRWPWLRAGFEDATEMRPRHLATTYGIHLGGYIGGGIGMILACAGVVSLRRRRSRSSVAETSTS